MIPRIMAAGSSSLGNRMDWEAIPYDSRNTSRMRMKKKKKKKKEKEKRRRKKIV